MVDFSRQEELGWTTCRLIEGNCSRDKKKITLIDYAESRYPAALNVLPTKRYAGQVDCKLLSATVRLVHLAEFRVCCVAKRVSWLNVKSPRAAV